MKFEGQEKVRVYYVSINFSEHISFRILNKVYICGENSYSGDSYTPKNLDGQYDLQYSTTHKKYFYQTGDVGDALTFYWYDDVNYNWIVSSVLFDADYAMMYRHRDPVLGSDWRVLNAGYCNPSDVRRKSQKF